MKRAYLIFLGSVVIVAALIGASLLIPSDSFVVLNEQPLIVPSIVTKSSKLSILAFGDLMLDRLVRTRINEYGPEYPFFALQNLFKDKDIIVANAEGVFTKERSLSIQNNKILRFTFATSTLPVLKSFGFTHLSQANNHSYDFGKEGQDESKKRIEEQGMISFGGFMNDSNVPTLTTIKNKTVAFIAYNEFAYKNKQNILEAIKEAKKSNAFTIVYPHWGIEYQISPSAAQIKLAHEFIDSGADLILGAHPHVVQSIEQYKGKIIFYSLGNFIFDQAFMPEVREGLAVEIVVDENNVNYILHPFMIREGQATLYDEPTTEKFIEKLLRRSSLGDIATTSIGFSI